MEVAPGVSIANAAAAEDDLAHPWLRTTNRVLAVAGMGLCVGLLAMRIYTKVRILRKFWWDDGTFSPGLPGDDDGRGWWLTGRAVCLLLAWVGWLPCFCPQGLYSLDHSQVFSVGTQAIILCMFAVSPFRL